jgi:hypothetical protein
MHRYGDWLFIIILGIVASFLIFTRLDFVMNYGANHISKGQEISTDKEKSGETKNDKDKDADSGDTTNKPNTQTVEPNTTTQQPTSTGEQKEIVEFRIEEGESLDSIAERLKVQGLIGDEAGFKNIVTSSGKDRNIRFGYYEIKKSMSVDEIIALITVQ